jgi:hypothetical protein
MTSREQGGLRDSRESEFTRHSVSK